MTELTQKQITFAQRYVECGNASEAYRQAYNVTHENTEWVKAEASKLKAHPYIALTILQLQEEAREQSLVTVASVTEELEQARQLAMQDKKGASAAVSASMGKAKIHGLIPDRREVTGIDGNPIFIEFSEADKALM